MSVIRLYAKAGLSKDVVGHLCSATGRSALDLRNAAKRGSPVAEFPLFKRDHDEVAARVRHLITSVTEDQVAALECVLDPQSGIERCHQSSFAVIANILDEAEKIARDLDGAQ
jgi:hypothetical protein